MGNSASYGFSFDMTGFEGLLTLENIVILGIALLVIAGLFRKRKGRQSGWHDDDDGWHIEIGSDGGGGDGGGGD